MKTKFRFLVSIARMLAMMPISVTAMDTTNLSELVVFDTKSIKAILNANGLETSYIRGLARNSKGTRIFFECSGRTDGETLVISQSLDGTQVQPVGGVSPVFNDDGKLVSSVVDHVLTFQSGTKLSLNPHARFGFTPGATFFFLYEPSKGAFVYRADAPENPVAKLPGDFIPQRIFERTNRVFVFGQKFDAPRSKTDAVGVILKWNGKNFEVDQEIDLSWAGGVIDMDTVNDSLLVETRRDLFPSWINFDLQTSKRISVGISQEHGLFLDRRFRNLLRK